MFGLLLEFKIISNHGQTFVSTLLIEYRELLIEYRDLITLYNVYNYSSREEVVICPRPSFFVKIIYMFKSVNRIKKNNIKTMHVLVLNFFSKVHVYFTIDRLTRSYLKVFFLQF